MTPRGQKPPAWWKPADQAELDVLTYELVRLYYRHKERCGICAAGEATYCRTVARMIEVVVDWRDYRRLRSEAMWLRLQQNDLDLAA